jgi:hypothetical protein
MRITLTITFMTTSSTSTCAATGADSEPPSPSVLDHVAQNPHQVNVHEA